MGALSDDVERSQFAALRWPSGATFTIRQKTGISAESVCQDRPVSDLRNGGASESDRELKDARWFASSRLCTGKRAKSD